VLLVVEMAGAVARDHLEEWGQSHGLEVLGRCCNSGFAVARKVAGSERIAADSAIELGCMAAGSDRIAVDYCCTRCAARCGAALAFAEQAEEEEAVVSLDILEEDQHKAGGWSSSTDVAGVVDGVDWMVCVVAGMRESALPGLTQHSYG